MDRRARAQHWKEQPARRVFEPVRHLSRRKNDRLAAGDSLFDRSRQPPNFFANPHGYQERERPHARLPEPQPRSSFRSGRVRYERREQGKKLGGARGDEISLHGLQQISRSGRLSRRRSALGNTEFHRSEYWRIRLEDS